MVDFLSTFLHGNVLTTLKIVYYSSFVWLPVLLLVVLFDLWVQYKQAEFLAKQNYVLLEIKVPREIHKSPRAMEFCIAGMHQTSQEKNWYEKIWKGQMRAEFSMEIVSIDGNIHFFIRARKSFKNQIEGNLYSQYPGIEVHEVPDYTLPFLYNPEVQTFWASEFKLAKESVFPIKTYIDYGMDDNPKEEHKIDPLTPFIEFIGSLPRGNQVWLQIIVRAHKAEDKDPKGGPKLVDLKWEKDAQVQIDKIINAAKGEKDKDGKLIPGTGRQLTEVEKETVSAVARSISKKGFDVGMRLVYTAPKDVFAPSNLAGIIGGITHFNSHLNGFAPTNGSDERYSHPLIAWKKRSEKTRNAERQDMLDAYKRRAYFYTPFKRKEIFVLNTEELATLFHLPGGVSNTPTFARIPSKKAEAPSNLPM